MIISLEDYIFLAVIVILLLISVIYLRYMDKREKDMDTINKAKRDMIDLEAITRNIEADYKPINIELSSYEQEQENNAIISYDELLNSRDNNVNYDENYDSGNIDINIKKVDLNDSYGVNVEEKGFRVSLMSYEKEEAFLRALKQLQSDLAR